MPTTIRYHEGAEVGYRWFARQHEKPPYTFGHGLSYTRFGYSDLQVGGGDTIAGHQQTSTTELVYRRELRPVIATGAEIMDRIFLS